MAMNKATSPQRPHQKKENKPLKLKLRMKEGKITGKAIKPEIERELQIGENNEVGLH